MDIHTLIVNMLNKKGVVKASDIVKATGFSRVYINRFFQKLRDEGKVVLLGKANRARYVFATRQAVTRARENITRINRVFHNKNLSEDVILDEIKKSTGIFLKIPENISRILDYAFTEMLNNAIEHSQSEIIKIAMEKDKNGVYFHVIDNGIGIFNNIMQKKHLNDEIEAIQDLTKGKLSTAPKAHSGEGIFFTSKITDMLIIQSSHKKLIFNNLINDIFIKDIKNIIGTKVTFSIGLDSDKTLRSIFKQYTDDSFKFDKTKVRVLLYKMSSEYISRSQARRILSGLDKFKTVILDFKDVETVGQGFADEVFRVWNLRYPNIKIIPHNANKNVQFMINRSSHSKQS